MLFSNHRQQFLQALSNTALKVWRRLQRIYTENTKFSIGLRIYYSGLRLYSSGTRTSYSFASSWFINMRNRTVAWFSRLTAKLFQENFPMKSSSRFRYCSDSRFRYDEPWNHPIIIHRSFSVYLQKIVRSKLHFVRFSAPKPFLYPINNPFNFLLLLLWYALLFGDLSLISYLQKISIEDWIGYFLWIKY